MIEKRPWGWFFTALKLPSFWIKLIRVKPEHRTSLQSHSQRSEIHISCNFFGSGMKHRMGPGWYIELAFGRPKENDITRYEDDYGRKDANIHR